ncbi:Protein UmuC [Apilactobacillus kunkeei]|nr:Protein UmuC [Apilactobacillus kunkeei]CAI2650574.1 Protein UmuC [Apilactobacillus kunkeei]CAI2803222.1 Protein UmuC [Apilactobacillus kunkeei]
MDYSNEPKGVFMVIDNKSFYASVECVQLGLNPLTASLVVMSDQDNTNGGLILASSPTAKKRFHITNVTRKRDLPWDDSLIVVPPRMNLYIQKNMAINKIFHEFADEEHCFPYSIDETILDLTHTWQLFGNSPAEVARKIQKTVRKRLGLYTTVGIGDNPVQAKLALDLFAKHNKDLVGQLSYDTFAENVWDIEPIDKIWSIGKHTAENLSKLGIHNLGELARTDPYQLKAHLGVMGYQLFAIAWGIDRSQLDQKVPIKDKGLSNSQVLPRDYKDQHELEVVITEIAEQVASRLRHRKKQTSCVHLYLGFSYVESEGSDRSSISHEQKITTTSDNRELVGAVMDLFHKYWHGERVRNVGVSYTRLSSSNAQQLDIFDDPEIQIKKSKVDKVTDEIRDKFGSTAIFKGHSLEKGATMLKRSGLVGGHNGGNAYD